MMMNKETKDTLLKLSPTKLFCWIKQEKQVHILYLRQIMLEKLNQLQQDIYKYSLNDDSEYIVDYSPKLSFFQVGNLFDINANQ